MRKNVVDADRWDIEDYENVNEQVAPITKTVDRLADINWTANRLVQDVFQSLHQSRPDMAERADMGPSYRVNQAVMDEFAKSPNWHDLREHTVSDPFNAGLATVTVAHQLEEMLGRLTEAQQAADEAEAARDEFTEANNDPNSTDSDLQEKAAAADEAAAKADELLSTVAPIMGRAIRGAVEKAADDAETMAADVAGWGLDAAGARQVDPSERLALASRLSTPRMRKIADMLGRLRNEAWAAETSRLEEGSGEVVGVKLSDDLSRIVPDELLFLTDPDLELDFLERYTRKQLLTLDVRSRAREAKGSIVYVEDSSASMHGDREIWARAVGLALQKIAAEHDRMFTVIVFGGPGETQRFEFAPSAPVTDVLSYAEFSFMSGTEPVGPLVEARQTIMDEHANSSGHGTSDVVFATDGEFEVTPEWVEDWTSSKTEWGFRVFGLAIGIGVSPALEAVCDVTFPVSALTDGSDIRDMFTTVSEVGKVIV